MARRVAGRQVLNLYVESSAVLRWLLSQAAGEEVRAALEAAVHLGASRITLLECERNIVRLASEGRRVKTASARAHLAELVEMIDFREVDAPVLARAAQPFPVEPVRSLDAIHLATLLEFRQAIPDIALLSTDDRITRNARALGFRVLP